MNGDFAEKFFETNRERILNLFATYQRIELLLFAKLYFPEKEKGIELINEALNKNTLGLLKAKYIEKYPDDEFDILDLISLVKGQRNKFMHSFWIDLALIGEDKENGLEFCNILLNSYESNADTLHDKVVELNLS